MAKVVKVELPNGESISVKSFQSIRSNLLWTHKIPLNGKLSEVTPFVKAHRDYVLSIANEISNQNPRFKLHELPLDYTTQPPYSRNQMIGITSDISKVQLVPWDPQIWEKMASFLGEIPRDVKAPANWAEFITFTETIKKSDSSHGWKATIEFVEKMLPDTWLNFTARMDFIDKILEKMNKDYLGKGGIYSTLSEHPPIYNKMKIDLEFMQQMKDFIIHQVTNISAFREERNAFMQTLINLRENMIGAIRSTDTRNNYDRIIKGLKILGSSVVIGTATFITAKTQLIDVFSSFTKFPELVYVATIGMAAIGAFIMDMTIQIRKKSKENRYIKRYDEKIRKVMNEVKEYVRTYLKLVGYKVTKLMANTGYLEALQWDVSNEYLAAAYKGDYSKLNKIYDCQVKDTLYPHRFHKVLRQLVFHFSKKQRESVYFDSKIQIEANTSDGYARPPTDKNGTIKQ